MFSCNRCFQLIPTQMFPGRSARNLVSWNVPAEAAADADSVHDRFQPVKQARHGQGSKEARGGRRHSGGQSHRQPSQFQFHAHSTG